jgi:hypothetical protein
LTANPRGSRSVWGLPRSWIIVEKRTIDDGGLHAGRAKEVGAGEAGDVLGHQVVVLRQDGT